MPVPRTAKAWPVAHPLLRPLAMVVFAFGVWIGAALGACGMGALWAQQRRAVVALTPLVEPAIHRPVSARVTVH